MNYNVEKMIETGRDIMKSNPKRDLGALEFAQLNERNPLDKFGMASDAYLVGVAIGMRIAKADAQKAKG